ncbi:MAG: putative ABC transporter permease [Lachnospiraceae bacterium]|nr:putative ABC transporter permease [Lachnospiraceae bacterium]
MNKKVFAKGYCGIKIFLFFAIGCLAGTFWEEILYFFQHDFVWVDRQGVIYGPFSPIYGVGVSIFVILLGRHNASRPIWKTYLYSCLIGGATEYATSLIADKVFHVSFWDYSNLFLNINGRTTVPYMLFWGLGGLILMKLVYPFISHWIEKIPYSFGRVAFPIFTALLMVDIILTYSAFGRMALRDSGIQPYTVYGQFLDRCYDDEFMMQKFPIMKEKDS